MKDFKDIDFDYIEIPNETIDFGKALKRLCQDRDHSRPRTELINDQYKRLYLVEFFTPLQDIVFYNGGNIYACN